MWIRIPLQTLCSDLALEKNDLEVGEGIASELAQLRHLLQRLLVLQLCHADCDLA